MAIRGLALRLRTRLVLQWYRRDTPFIVRCDAISKWHDPCDVSLCAEWFRRLEAWWGPHTVDRAAAFHNAVVPRFFSRFFHSSAEGQGMFSRLWSGKNNWVNPPWCLIARSIEHLQRGRACGTMVVPSRPWAIWWPLTVREAQGVVDVVVLPMRPGIFVGRAASGRTVRARAVRFDFRVGPFAGQFGFE